MGGRGWAPCSGFSPPTVNEKNVILCIKCAKFPIPIDASTRPLNPLMLDLATLTTGKVYAKTVIISTSFSAQSMKQGNLKIMTKIDKIGLGLWHFEVKYIVYSPYIYVAVLSVASEALCKWGAQSRRTKFFWCGVTTIVCYRLRDNWNVPYCRLCSLHIYWWSRERGNKSNGA